MTLKIVFLVVLILVFIRLFSGASWRIQKSRIKLSKVTGDIMSNEQLQELGEQMAKICTAREVDCRDRIRAELESYYEYITSVYKQLNLKVCGGEEIPEAAQWILDNYYIIEKEIGKIEDAFSSKALSRLSVIKDGKYAGKPVIYALAQELAAHRLAQIDFESVTALLGAYTQKAYLKSDEIWLFFDMIKLILIKNTAYLCKKIRFSIKEYDYAKKYAGYVLSKKGDKEQMRRRVLRYFERGRISSAFLSVFLREAKTNGEDGAFIASVAKKALGKRSIEMHKMILEEQSTQSRYQTDMGRCIRSVIELERLNMTQVFDEVSEVVRLLHSDPDGTYSKMDAKSRQLYVSEVCEIARRAKTTEANVVRKALSLAETAADTRKQSLGYYLVSSGRASLLSALGAKAERRVTVWKYITLIWGGALIIGAAAALLILHINTFAAVSFGFFVTILASQFTTRIIGDILLKINKTKIIPKLDFCAHIPVQYSTFVVTTSLLTDKKQADELVQNMEDFYLLNRQDNLYFAVLADYKDSQSDECDSALYDYMSGKIKNLNEKYSSSAKRFYFLIRRKVFSESEGRWMGAERKRGAICDFVRLLKTGERGDFINAADEYATLKIKYVITLDADTKLHHDSAAQMIGAMAHPVNTPVIDEQKNVVTEGYGIMQPRVGVDIESAGKTLYTKIYAMCGGLDAYSGAASDLYQDLFGEAIFVGKGIFDTDVFYSVLNERFPKDRVLSHDLLEGSYLRCALLSDVNVSDSYPKTYLSHIARVHRWTRGDWQLIGWLGIKSSNGAGEEKNPLNLLSRYKIFDNLRRGVMIYVKLRLIAASLLLSAPYSYAILGFVFVTGAYNIINEMFLALSLRLSHKVSPKFNANIIYGVKRALIEFLLDITMLVYESYVMADAAIRALHRMFISKKKLLSWVTASETEKKDMSGPIYHYKKMWISPAFGSLCIFALPFADVPTSLIFLVIGIWWICAPYIACEISAPLHYKKNCLKPENKRLFSDLTRLMWRYFEDFATEEHNYIAPDNIQIEPKFKTAARTSPTNIGLLLASTLCARDFGYISTLEMTERMERVLDTIDKLDKWRGHLLNWYNTKTLEVMEPRYVSTVDSGNYIADLIMISNGILEYKNVPNITKKHMRALCDTLKLAMRENKGLKIDISELERLICGDNTKKAQCITVLRRLANTQNCKQGSLHEKACLMAQRFADELEDESSKNFRQRIDDLSRRMKKNIDETDFTPLYDENRQLFSIGYDIHEEKINNSYYDLLMSEARQTSYIAVARGEVSYKHWFRLGRNMATADMHTGLMSWTGTMFEYMMPLLLLKSYRNTIFDESYNFALREQMKYAMKFAPIYGISESGYYSFDAELNYSYKAFGVPVLGLKRGLSNEQVIAPYASVMSAMLAPNTAAENVKNLISLGVCGTYGLYEAVDFTKRRLMKGENMAIVKSYMVHHIGMSILALCNLFYENILQERFMKNCEMRANSYILGEKIPICPNVSRAAKYGSVRTKAEAQNVQISPCVRTYEYRSGLQIVPAHILSNKSCMMYLDANGCGYAKQNDICINRPPSPDGKEQRGFFIFISDEDTGKVYPTGFLPGMNAPESGYVKFFSDRAEYSRCDGKLDTKTEIVLCAEDNVQLYNVKLTNHADTDKLLTLTFYCEIILTRAQSDEAHRAFSNLFVSTDYDEKNANLLATRRKRFDNENQMWACLGIASGAEMAEKISIETDREKFLGRNNTITDAEALKNTLPLSGSVGAVLDGVFAMRVKINVGAMQSADVSFILASGESRDEAVRLCSKYKEVPSRAEALERASAYAAAFVRYASLQNGEEEKILSILPYLTSCSNIKRAYGDKICRNTLSQSGLWRFAVSGDNKLLLAVINGEDDFFRLHWALKIYKYYNIKGLALDLAVICSSPRGYSDDIVSRARETAQSYYVGRSGAGSVFVISRTEISEDEINLFYTAAVFVLDENTPGMTAAHCMQEKNVEIKSAEPMESDLLEKEQLLYFNGIGGFDAKNGDYIINLKNNESTPMPWSNILANEGFGAIVTESGGGFCFDKNSALNKLTEWTNDAVSDTCGESIYIKDENGGHIFSPTRNKINKNGDYKIRYTAGCSTFFHNENALNVKMEVFVPHDAPVKLSTLTVKNTSDKARRLTLFYIIRPIMASRLSVPCTLVSEFKNEILKVKNVYNSEFAGEICFVASTLPIQSYTANAAELSEQSCGAPAALFEESFDGETGAGMDTVMALRVSFEIGAKEEKQMAFMLGAADSSEINRIAGKYRDINAVIESLNATKRYWKDMTGGISVKTPDKSMDIMINSYLLYQSAACRLFARSAFYQCGGAFGFRDQLQDVLAFMHHRPEMAKKQILYHCAHQFEEGDVLHWWHSVKNGNDRGIRTRFSDDLLWLAYVSLEYIRITGDEDILSENEPFVLGASLGDGVDEMYYEVTQSEKKASLYEHILLAVKHALKTGERGLLLMGSGDWNDGMNKIGNGGKGESVWLTWFMCDILKKLVPICQKRGDSVLADGFEKYQKSLAEAANQNAWDGKWYIRAFFDDGTPVGSSKNNECKIDSIAQSWAMISGAGEREKVKTALDSVHECLVERQNGLIKLLKPAFTSDGPSPGYIASYVEGVRENGGQYTHAAVWVIMAAAMSGNGSKACEYFNMLNPINHTKTPMETARYKTEPYVLSADVYTNPAHIGRGGWSFYTGAAAWYYKVGVEYILGLKREGTRLYVRPCIGDDWKQFEVVYRYDGSEYRISAVRDTSLKNGMSVLDSPNGDFVNLEKDKGNVCVNVRFN